MNLNLYTEVKEKMADKNDLKRIKIPVKCRSEMIELQKLLFSIGVRWNGDESDCLEYLGSKYLFIDEYFNLTHGNDEQYFYAHKYQYVCFDYVKILVMKEINKGENKMEFKLELTKKKEDLSKFDTDNLIAGMAKIIEEKKSYEIQKAAEVYKRITDEMDKIDRTLLAYEEEMEELKEKKAELAEELKIFRKKK